MFQLAYFQMVGAGKARNQDALFDGTAVRQVRLHKTRVCFIFPPRSFIVWRYF